ncbi:MAG: beta-ketoacyl synthase [Bacteroidales bacterium]|nr:beta-ketoacyl synthase [Bacteroidales bacterium]
MLKRLGDSIISKLGIGSRKNYMAVRNGQSGVEHCPSGTLGVPEPFMASLIDRELLNDHFMPIGGNRVHFYTPFEKLAILAVHQALQQANIDAAAPQVQFILSTTKGNIGLLEQPEHPYGPQRVHLWQSARLLAQFFGNSNEPLVVSNACISGLCAQIQADRLLALGQHSVAVVVGAEVLSKFIISGFQSFKALSPTRCRPFDAARDGLNLGEGAACIVYQRREADCPMAPGEMRLSGGAIRNDANHISGPSRTGEGLYNAITAVRGGHSEPPAFISAHGTATPYNDEMEAIALSRAGLLSAPTFSLKPHFGHTLGAAGVLETVISMHALADGVALGSWGAEHLGVSHKVNITPEMRPAQGATFLKLMSGFGGSNAAIAVSTSPNTTNTSQPCE